MGQNQIETFCSAGDLVAMFDNVREQVPIFFALAGRFETPAVRSLHSPAEISDFMAGSSESTFSLLAMAGADAVGVREVPQKRGSPRYGIDQLSNPTSVVIRPGRLIGERTLLAGQIGTASDAPSSVELFSTFSNAVRNQFTKVKSYWVGPEALRLLDAGGRLTTSLKAPAEYDLRR